MKKLVLLLACLMTALMVSGCAGEAEPFEQKSYTMDAAQLAGIAIDVRDRTIDVTRSDDAQIHIVCFENSREFYDVGVGEDGMLQIRAARDKQWTDYIGRSVQQDLHKISVQLPDGLLEQVRVSTTNGDIRFARLSVLGSITLDVNGGDLVLDAPDAHDFVLQAKNGDISGMIQGEYGEFAIHTEIKKGESNLPAAKSGGERTLTVSNNNGDINLEFAGR